MGPRQGSTRSREVDFSAVGKAGRRTGITLPQQRLDEHGLEEVSHLFSSPKKPSPLKNYILAELTEEEWNDLATKPALSTRKTPRVSVPRSASPRKSGINGTAKRTNGLDIRSTRKVQKFPEPEEQENALPTSPTLANQPARRFSPNRPGKAPLRDITAENSPTQPRLLMEQGDAEEDIVESVENSYEQPIQIQQATPQNQSMEDILFENDDTGAIMSDAVDDGPQLLGAEDEHEVDGLTHSLPQLLDEEAADQSFAPERPAFLKNLPNSRRKRKSDLEMPETSPAAKRARGDSPIQQRKGKAPMRKALTQEPAPPRPAPAISKGKAPLKNRTANSKMSVRQEKELEDCIERIKSRPNPPKSLHILRRETPADDSVNITRSGRVSFKPLAYWRNERCVWGQSPNSAALKDGARYPLNSIKEIIRAEEVEAAAGPKKKGRKSKKSGSKSRSKTDELEDASDSELDDDTLDPDAEEWENQHGIFRGPVAVWDPELQTSLDEEEDIEIAYAPAAIETTEVRNSSQSGADQPSFKYAKLLGNSFMGVGLVDLPPGGVKRPKNSRKMHMSFYVVKGRVTVKLGMSGTEGNQFSIGKGGFWQVPRGNQYSIENESDKPARMFFSQGCEVEVALDDD